MKGGVEGNLRQTWVAIAAIFIIVVYWLAWPQSVFALDGGVTTDLVTALNINEPTGPLSDFARPVTTYEPLPYVQPITQDVDCGIEHCLALTFDDGPDNATTPQILDALEHVQAHATFFVVGSRIASHADILRRIQALDDEVGNHSWSHPDFTKLRPDQIHDQIVRTQQAVVDTGLPAPRFFRPPYEARNDSVRQAVNMPFVLWNVDPEDWKLAKSDDVAKSVIAQAKPGAIIVLHDLKLTTAQALPKILDELKNQYHFVTVSQLLNLPQNTVGEFTSR